MHTEDNTIYKELAELKLQNRLLEGRLTMMTKGVTSRDMDRAEIARQLGDLGYLLVGNIIQKKDK